MSNYNRYPPAPSARYSPSAPSGASAPYALPPDFPPFPGKLPGAAPVPYQPYDEYEPGEMRYEPARVFEYEQPHAPHLPQAMPPFPPPRRSFDYEPKFAYDQPKAYEDAYDPYQPTAVPAPASTSTFVPPPAHLSSLAPVPPPTLTPAAPVPFAPTPSSHAPPRRAVDRNAPDLQLLTPVTMATIGKDTLVVHALPASSLPITKYVTLNAADSVDLHRALCMSGLTRALWYGAASTRAGEGWFAAIEWDLDASQSRAKLRGCVLAPDGGPAHVADPLVTELAALCKAVDGFKDQLALSIRQQKPISHELVVFLDSAAAIVSADTSSAPEARRFRDAWRAVCTEYPRAHLTLAWVARGADVEGHTLAEKIATVAASNSFLRRKKERNIPDPYNRPGGGEPLAGASTEPGPWQRGEAEPNRPTTPYERPQLRPHESTPPRQASPSKPTLELRPRSRSRERSSPAILRPRSRSRSRTTADGGLGLITGPDVRADDDSVHPRADALCVANFPESISAKDLGMLFTQFGDIVSVDIFSVPPVRPRFAFVTYVDPEPSIAAAMAELDNKPIRLDSAYARENASDLAGWRGFEGTLAVVRSDPTRLLPASVAQHFPDLPEYATAGGGRGCQRRRSAGEDRKRSREPSVQVKHEPRSQSPKKPRQDDALPEFDLAQAFNSAAPVKPEPEASAAAAAVAPHRAHVLVPNHAAPTLKPATLVPAAAAPSAPATHAAHPPHPSLPPTPLTAQHAAPDSQSQSTTASAVSAELRDGVPSSASGSGGLTNSAAEPQEHPIVVGARTLRAQLSLVRHVFAKHDAANWIAHACLLATDLDQARRELQADLYATDEAFISGRELERALAAKGFTPARVDAFIRKVLGVLDGIAAADDAEAAAVAAAPDGDTAPNGHGEADEVTLLGAELDAALAPYPVQTREALHAAATVMEYLHRGKAAQARKRLDVERRVKVLEGMARIGEQVGSVVRFLLTEDK
ncbi:hypothetical protein Q5752_004708 [Cryptotrichosporon argae]